MKIIKFVSVLFLFITAIIIPQNINGRISSSIYAFERFDTLNASSNHLRSYQMLNLNINEGNFSLKTYFNLESDLSSDLTDDPRLRFYNLFLEGRNLFEILTFKLGRQPVFNSVGGGLFDGLTLALKKSGYKITGFAGGNVPAYQKLELTDDLKNDFLIGGKLTISSVENLQVDINYIKKNFKPYSYQAIRLDSDLNPITVIIKNNSNKYEYISGEVTYGLPDMFNLNARYDYDISYKQTSKVELNGRYEVMPQLGISAYFNYREPLIRYNSIFSVFDFGNTTEYEFGGDYIFNPTLSVFAKYGYVQYKNENSGRVSAGLNTRYGTVSYRKTFGYAGELDALSLYSGYTFLEGLLTPSIGFSFTSYKLSEDSEQNSLVALLAGINIRPVRMFSVDLQGQFINNKIYKNDYRLFLKLNYWFNTNLNLL